MPYLMNTGDRVDHLVNATIHLINTDGIESFTIRRLAAVARVSTSAITSHLDSKWRMTDLFTKRIADRLHREIRTNARLSGVRAFVPDDELLPLVRTWLAMCELARADDGLSEGVAYVQQDFLNLLHLACRLGPDDEVVLDAVHALVVGIWTARCARSNPMSSEHAAAVLHHACTAMGVPMEPEVA
jgi:AcrR family transcriptional regulator